LLVFLRLLIIASTDGLSSGDRVPARSTKLSILWPPRVIQDPYVLSVIKRAIGNFEKAKAKDKRLEGIYDSLNEKELDLYTNESEGSASIRSPKFEKIHEQLDRLEFREQSADRKKRTKLLKQTVIANESLRLAANHLSLAFCEDNRFLFLGDLERNELKRVVTELQPQEKRKKFCVLITPHHGTHWHPDLACLRVILAISSVGKSGFTHVHKAQFKAISNTHLCTHRDGDILVGFTYDRRKIVWRTHAYK